MTLDEIVKVTNTQLAVVIGLLGGGIVAYGTGVWYVGLLIAVVFTALAPALIQLAETQPITDSQPTSVLDVLEPPRH